MLAHETRQFGRWLLLLDQTYYTQQGTKTENTFSHGQKSKSGKERRRRKKSPAHRCHCFVMGLLLTPSGFRIPLCRSYYTKEYWAAKEQEAFQARRHPLSPSDGVGGGIGAYGARAGRCENGGAGRYGLRRRVDPRGVPRRGCTWIVPMNQERVLAVEKPRPKVWSLVPDFRASQFAPVKLTPGKGRFVASDGWPPAGSGRK